jgi:hypothetical protein
MPGPWFVEVLGDNLTFRLWDDRALVIGRDESCGLILASSSVARKHAALWLKDGDVWFRPEGSRGPLLINDVPYNEAQRLHLDDVLLLPGCQLRLVRACDITSFWAADEGKQVVQLARIIAAANRYDELPILADALEDAGCSDPAILEHCRRPHPHPRGCCLLEQVLAASALNDR